jgi:hypothetical protein
MSGSGRCQICGQGSRLTPAVLSVCVDCIRTSPEAALPLALQGHEAIRCEFDLPPEPPRTMDGIECPLCVNACRLGEGELGLCGLRTVREGRLVRAATSGARSIWPCSTRPVPLTVSLARTGTSA